MHIVNQSHKKVKEEEHKIKESQKVQPANPKQTTNPPEKASKDKNQIIRPKSAGPAPKKVSHPSY
jgi:hypothetical protein